MSLYPIYNYIYVIHGHLKMISWGSRLEKIWVHCTSCLPYKLRTWTSIAWNREIWDPSAHRVCQSEGPSLSSFLAVCFTRSINHLFTDNFYQYAICVSLKTINFKMHQLLNYNAHWIWRYVKSLLLYISFYCGFWTVGVAALCLHLGISIFNRSDHNLYSFVIASTL